ncbi:Hypothetical protein BCD_1337 (plasmid) [Borrelia crocidurae DOU]|uniref:Lipoprotein n=2 Tax=Borrelia crocidurae TaxID=29520 RepID=W5SL61_9SPIR|nr:Hypothetical protein BCD_1337 [Borrelia crocidurae DOU]
MGVFMKRMNVLICVVNFLVILGCVGPTGMQGLRGPDGRDGEKGQDHHGDVELLMSTFLVLKSSYNYNLGDVKKIKDSIEKSSIFSHVAFEDKFQSDKNKDYICIAVKSNELVFEDVLHILRLLVGGRSSTSQDHNVAKNFLNSLLDSASYIDEVINLNLFTPDFDLDRLRSFDRSAVFELNFLLMGMLGLRESIVNDIKILLKNPNLATLGSSSPSNLKVELAPIIDVGGNIYEKIYGDNDSLKSLRDLIIKKINTNV